MKHAASSRGGLGIVLGLLVFAGAFIGLATWMGSQDRTPAFPKADGPWTSDQQQQCRSWNLARPFAPELINSPEPAVQQMLQSATADPAALRALLPALNALCARDQDMHWLLLAAVQVRLGEDATAAAQSAARGSDANALHLLAQAHLLRGHAPAALDAAERTVQLAPGSAEAHRMLARAAELSGDSGKAKHAWRVVAHLLPADAEARGALSRYE